MCEYCKRRIHGPGCPNAFEGGEMYLCTYCKDGIESGEVFVEFLNQVFHKSCFFDHAFAMHEDEFLEAFDLQTSVVGDDE